MRMSVQLEGLVIERPVEDVFAFTSNLENSPLWGRTKKTVKDSDDPVSVGTVFLEEAKIVSREVKHRSEVTVWVPTTRFSYSSFFENGTKELTRITLETVDEGTRLNVTTEVEMERVPQVLAPFFSLLVEQRVRSLLQNLKEALEPKDRSVVGAGALIAIGAVLLATAGMRYLIEIFPEGGLWPALALFASSLFSAAVAGIVWRTTRGWRNEQKSSPRLEKSEQTLVASRESAPDKAVVAAVALAVLMGTVLLFGRRRGKKGVATMVVRKT